MQPEEALMRTRIGFLGVAVVLLVAIGGCKNDVGEACELESGDYSPEDLRVTVVIEEDNSGCESSVCIGTEARVYCSAHCTSDDDCQDGMVCTLIDTPTERSVCYFTAD
jgi:hypothetical protein